MKTCLFLDGLKAGTFIACQDLPPYWDFPCLPKKIEMDSQVDSKPLPLDIIRYKLTFVSVNKEWGLYSLAGEADILVKFSDWIITPGSLKRPQPVYFEQPATGGGRKS